MKSSSSTLSLPELLGIMTAAHLILGICLIGLVLITLLGLAFESAGLWPLAAFCTISQYSWFGLCLYCLYKGHTILVPQIMRSESKTGVTSKDPLIAFRTGVLWGLFCCFLPLQTWLRRETPATKG